MSPLTSERLRHAIHTHTTRVFEAMVGLPLQATNGSASPHGEQGAILSLIGVTGPWNGSGGIACSDILARRLAGRLLMTECDTVDAGVLDAMGEIANMIIGNIKEDIATEVGALQISTPTVIHGLGLLTRNVNESASATVVFDCGGERLEVHVGLLPAA